MVPSLLCVCDSFFLMTLLGGTHRYTDSSSDNEALNYFNQ